MTQSEQFKKVLEVQEMARALGTEHDPFVQHRIRLCLSKNSTIATRYIEKTMGALTVAMMRMALDQQVPTWSHVPADRALTLGLEVLSRQPIHLDANILTKGVVLITGSGYGAV